MKIQLASDLHLEFLQRDWPGERLIGPVPGADVLVLAGDIANGAEPFLIFADWPSHSERVPIIMVAGNHEFYHHDIEGMRIKMKEGAALNNIHFLENESVLIDSVRFLGATLWTDYKLRSDRNQSQQMEVAERSLNDHRLILTGRNCFTAQDALDRHEASRAWLSSEFAKHFEGKTVVITHHGPHLLSVHPKCAGNPLNSAFVSDLTDVVRHADLWLHGHVHDGFDYQIGNCRVVANPAGYVLNRGYPHRNGGMENSGFNPGLVVEV